MATLRRRLVIAAAGEAAGAFARGVGHIKTKELKQINRDIMLPRESQFIESQKMPQKFRLIL